MELTGLGFPCCEGLSFESVSELVSRLFKFPCLQEPSAAGVEPRPHEEGSVPPERPLRSLRRDRPSWAAFSWEEEASREAGR